MIIILLITGCASPEVSEVPKEVSSSESSVSSETEKEESSSSVSEAESSESSSEESSSVESSSETSSEQDTSSEAETSSAAESSSKPEENSSSSSSSAKSSESEKEPEKEQPKAEEPKTPEGYVDSVSVDSEAVKEEAVIVEEAPAPAVSIVLEPKASGNLVEENSKAIIDYSNTRDGYVMVKYTADTQKKLKTQIKGPRTTYTYNIYKGNWAVLPITDGNGTYQVKVYENVSGNEYSLALAVETNISLKDEFAPFLRPNQYVNYSASSGAVKKAKNLCAGLKNPLDKVQAIYTYVVNNIRYDKNKAATVTSGYLPVLDDVLYEGKGICFDYAALMTGMLRSQGVPCKMVFGYAGTAYHAWISVWTEDEGWVDGAIFFDGTSWHRLDPTFASSGGPSAEIMQYIGNGSNYQSKYFY